MTRRVFQLTLSLSAAVLAIGSAAGQPKIPAPAPSCKTYGGGKCCDPVIAAHLPKEAVWSACGESEATYLGEQAGKDSCKYYFKVKDEKEEESFVEVYVPKFKETQTSPSDPFFQWKRVGRAFYTERALSPKAAPMAAQSTGLWLAGKGYVVSVNATRKVCTKPEAKKLALKMK